jgi:hypothetical protein
MKKKILKIWKINLKIIYLLLFNKKIIIFLDRRTETLRIKKGARKKRRRIKKKTREGSTGKVEKRRRGKKIKRINRKGKTIIRKS